MTQPSPSPGGQPGAAPAAPLDIAFAHFDAGRLAEAEGIARELLRADADDANAWRLYGMIALRLGQPAFAIDAMRRAAALHPDVPEFQYSLGNALRITGRASEAVQAYQAALALRPDYSDALINLGLAAEATGDKDAAQRAWETALRLHPDDVDALTNLGSLHRAAGRIGPAIALLEQALTIDPATVSAAANLVLTYLQAGRFDRELELCRAEIARGPRSPLAHSTLVLCLCYCEDASPQELFAAHRRWDELHGRAPIAHRRPHANDRSPERQLRVGYVSGDFREHPVAHFIEPLLRHHDREQVRVFCYSTTAGEDATSARLRGLAEEWRVIAALPDDRAAELIRADAIDILIDLSGHTSANRLPLLARKPAPVQVTYLGYPHTTGLTAIDYRLTDAIADPPAEGAGALSSEELVRLPSCAWCFAALSDVPDLDDRSDGMRDDDSGSDDDADDDDGAGVTFGSFNNHAKNAPATIALWGRVLSALPRARMLLKATALDDESVRRLLLERFAAAGVEADRLILRGRTSSRGEHLASYREVDIALDPVRYNGTTTTCEALWMQVPVITLAGEQHMSRVGASLLTAAGLSDLIARTPEQFVEIAVRLARDRQRRRKLRRELRSIVAASPLCDGRRLARDVERAFREMWRRWTAGARAPE